MQVNLVGTRYIYITMVLLYIAFAAACRLIRVYVVLCFRVLLYVLMCSTVIENDLTQHAWADEVITLNHSTSSIPCTPPPTFYCLHLLRNRGITHLLFSSVYYCWYYYYCCCWQYYYYTTTLPRFIFRLSHFIHPSRLLLFE